MGHFRLAARAFHDDGLEAQARRCSAQFRMRADEEPADPRYAEVVADLLAHHTRLRPFWQRHDVDDYRTVYKDFAHPRVGPAHPAPVEADRRGTTRACTCWPVPGRRRRRRTRSRDLG
ncbi:hypothetical protein Srubr_18650 [Streptomyces rubradiris]|uniref:MmyB-like transcription regulator ligand binding domain-containing protein n=1 Tax=Streptomyces rubradiris TaxID=285531 RepID=A0ABQ3R843_STRRR|nr:hypothetical protein Srubr_18650 [Streptomyces rubradiris]